MNMLDVRGLALGYNNNTIVEDLSFTVEEGDYLCIVGDNGAGKTTLMRTLLGLQKPLGGTITAGEGFSLSKIGYLPQQTAFQKDFPATVREIVLSGFQGSCGLRAFYTAEEKKIAYDNMKRMKIEDLSRKSYRNLSGGQQQRVLLARALCAAGRTILLDEPVAGLDPETSSEMYRMIENLNKTGMTIIMISHDISSALRYAGHILRIGNPAFFGTVEEYLLRLHKDKAVFQKIGGRTDD